MRPPPGSLRKPASYGTIAAVWLPIFALLAQNVHAGEPIPPLTIVDAFSLIFVSFLIFDASLAEVEFDTVR